MSGTGELSVDRSVVDEIMKAGHALYPGTRALTVESVRVGERPIPGDGLPVLHAGPSRGRSGWVATSSELHGVIGASRGYPDTKHDFAAHRGYFMIMILRKAGISSSMLYTAGMASIGLSIASWFASRNVESKGIARADRWGIFVGQWAPTFFALGNAMRMEEEMGETRPARRIEEMKTRAKEKMPMT